MCWSAVRSDVGAGGLSSCPSSTTDQLGGFGLVSAFLGAHFPSWVWMTCQLGHSNSCTLVIPNPGHQIMGPRGHGRKLPSYLGALDTSISQDGEEDGSVNNSWHASSKNLEIINAGEGVEKREPFCTVGGNVN